MKTYTIALLALIAVPVAAIAVPPPGQIVAAILSGHWTEVYVFDGQAGVEIAGSLANLETSVLRGADVRVMFNEPNSFYAQVFTCDTVRLHHETGEVTCYSQVEPASQLQPTGWWRIISTRQDQYTISTTGDLSQFGIDAAGTHNLLPGGAPVIKGTTSWFVRY